MPAIPHNQQPLPPPSAAEEAVIDNINIDNNSNSREKEYHKDHSQQEAQSQDLPTEPQTTQVLPKPTLRFQIHDVSHEGVQHFLSAIDVSHILQEAVDTVCHILYNAPPTSTNTDVNKDIPATTDTKQNTNNTSETTTTTTTTTTITTPAPPRPPIPPIRSITLVLTPMPGVAHTSSIPLDILHKEIHLSLSYIAHVASQHPSAGVKHELTGVLVHETVHTLQNDGAGTAPSGLIEGIADYVRLRAGLGAAHWKRPGRRAEVQGVYEWDAGYERTAFFLEWLEGREGGKGSGTVGRMNEWLRVGRYDDGDDGDGFWREVCGEGVQGLWSGYLEWVEEEGEMAEAIAWSLRDG